MTLIIISSFIILLLTIGLLFVNLSPEFGAPAGPQDHERYRQSDNYHNGKFKNKEKTVVMTSTDWHTFSGYFTNSGNKVPDKPAAIKKLADTYFFDRPANETRATWFGHSAILIEIEGQKIFCDPMLGSVPAPHPWLGTKRFNDTLPMAINKLPLLDAVLISHDHYDHLDYGSIIKLTNKTKHFYVPLGVKAHLLSWGIPESKVTELDWWQEISLGNLAFVATPARHFSGRGLLDRNSTLWCSWVIRGQQHNLFFGGDSGYTAAFKEIGQKFGPFDLTMLECGQYNEQWSEIHMMPEETAQAHQDLNGDVLMPIHWGAFKLALHSWTEPVQRLLKAAESTDIRVATPQIGEAIVIGKQVPAGTWWQAK